MPGVDPSRGAGRRARRRGDLQVVRSPRAAGATHVREELCIVTSNGQIEREDLHPLKHTLNELAAPGAMRIVGEFDPDKQLRRGHRGDRDIVIITDHDRLTRRRIGSLESDQRPRVEDQSIAPRITHGSVPDRPPNVRQVTLPLAIRRVGANEGAQLPESARPRRRDNGDRASAADHRERLAAMLDSIQHVSEML